MVAASKTKIGVVIFITFIIYIIHVVFASLAGRGGAPSLFPNTVGNVSDTFKLAVTPVSATFSIWGIIFAWQFLWLIYTLSTVFRSGRSTDILCIKFYVTFIINILFITGWLFAWSRKEVISSFIVVAIGQIFIDIAFGLACSDLNDFLSTHEVANDNKFDIWCQRILVQNGLLFYATWTTVATLINTAVALSEELGTSGETASLIVLSFLAVCMFIWFFVENFALQNYTEYTFSAYIALIYGLSGITAASWGTNEAVGGLTLALLIVSILLFVSRIVIIVIRSSKRSSYDAISYNSASNTVRT